MYIYRELHEIHPAVPGLVLMFALWLAAFLVRTKLPGVWKLFMVWPNPESPIGHMIQALPTTAIGAAFAGWQLGGLDGALYGAVSGAGAPILHHVLKNLPGPYRGALNDAAQKWAKAREAARLDSNVDE